MWSDIGDKLIILRKTKPQGQDQSYPAFAFVKETLTNIFNLQKDHCDYVWADKSGKRLSQMTISKVIRRYMIKAGYIGGLLIP